MNDKLKGYKAEPMSEADQENIEIEALETKEEELVPDPTVTVPTGDEDAPTSAPVHSDGLKSLYDKGRKNREKLVSREGDDHPDVALIQQLTAEAAGGVEREELEEGVDTNRGDRFDEDRPEPELIDEPDEPVIEEQATPSLPDPEPDVRVGVKILGKHYDVPQQDIDDAGGLEAYQKNRAATIRLQRAATLEREVLQAKQALERPPEQPVADPSPPDGQGEADIDSLRNELMDTVIEGTEDDINKWIDNLRSQPVESPPPAPRPAAEPEPVVTETQAELQQQYMDDMESANNMMREDFPDIMQGSRPGASELERRRLADAQDYFRVLASDPHNEGRSQKEMAREAAFRARRIVYPEEAESAPVPPMEQERRTRIERKRKLPQPSRADAPAPASRKQERKVPTRREHLMRLRRRAGLEYTPDE